MPVGPMVRTRRILLCKNDLQRLYRAEQLEMEDVPENSTRMRADKMMEQWSTLLQNAPLLCTITCMNGDKQNERKKQLSLLNGKMKEHLSFRAVGEK